MRVKKKSSNLDFFSNELNPFVSIIIPCRNELEFINKCLDSVFSFEDLHFDVEVIVVDGMSCDGTREVLSKWENDRQNLRVLDNPKQIVPSALNIGIKASKGQWIVRLDAHAEYPKNYLFQCIKTSQKKKADNVGGIVITKIKDSSIQARWVQAITTHRFGVGNANFRLNTSEKPVDTVPYGCYRREVFNNIGFFDERLVRNQDYEFNRRLIKNGGLIWLNPEIKVYYYNKSSLKGLFRQAFNTAKWNAWMWYIAPYTFAFRHFIPSAFLLSLLIFISLAIFFNFKVFLLLALTLYFFASIISSLKQSLRYGFWMFFILPFLFFIYHLSYGFGTLWGAIKLLIKKSPVQDY